MTRDQDLPADDARAEAAAAWWFAHTDGALGPEDEVRFAGWMADPANAAAYRAVEAATGLFDDVGAAELAGPRAEARRRLADARRARPALSRRAVLGAGLGLAAAAVVAGVVILPRPHPQTTRFQAADRPRRVELPDGSILALDAHSQVTVTFTAGDRRLELTRGQLRIDVARDSARPLSVQAAGHEVVATGTAFNVDLVGRAARISLIEGSVDVWRLSSGRRQGQATALQAGERIDVAPGSQGRRGRFDVSETTAWQRGKLEFNDERLADAVARMNRYAPAPIAADSDIAGLRITGVFDAGATDTFVEAITSYLPVTASTEPDGAVRLTHRR